MSRYVELAFNLPVKRQFTYRVPDGVELQTGCRVSAPFGSRLLTGLTISTPTSPPEGVGEIKDVKRAIDSRPLVDGATLELARWMARMYMCSLGEALFTMLPGGRREGESDELPPEEDVLQHALAPQQERAVRAIAATDGGSFYLFGVTGSGKTDVYLHAAMDATSRGKGVLYLVPEISLTHQVVRVFRRVYRTRLAVLHSALTPSQRLAEWLRVMDGEVDVVIGARSAVFAPLRSLGLIVIDEEQEGAYKSGTTPRYHARQVAMYRAAREKARLVMGSATPSLEAWHFMSDGRLTALRMDERLSGGAMPSMEIVDMRKQRGPLSQSLMDAISRTTGEGRQAILFLNRRGFSYLFHCRSCGYEMACPHCSVALTYHKERDKMICHYCGTSAAPIAVCPVCGSLDVGYSGFGTEGIEEELEHSFPQLVVRRIDTDAVRKKRVLQQILSDFREARVQVLVGTQMVAKGLDFPGVKLVGIINADTGLQLPDFRAAERTFSLLVQVAGRAGRALPDGRVLIQTFRPGAAAVRLARQGKLEEFYADELSTRKTLGFPPFSRLIRILLRGKNRQKTLSAIGALTTTLASYLEGSGETLGPAECPLARISGNYRYHTIVRTRKFSEAHARVSQVLEGYRAPRGVYVEVDVDPQALL
ncbi:MAG TPA: primosomal protein N' [Spirochaetia bacterium]|nr:primosomal protein N' [Spirochaetia bacterium]